MSYSPSDTPDIKHSLTVLDNKNLFKGKVKKTLKEWDNAFIYLRKGHLAYCQNYGIPHGKEDIASQWQKCLGVGFEGLACSKYIQMIKAYCVKEDVKSGDSINLATGLVTYKKPKTVKTVVATVGPMEGKHGDYGYYNPDAAQKPNPQQMLDKLAILSKQLTKGWEDKRIQKITNTLADSLIGMHIRPDQAQGMLHVIRKSCYPDLPEGSWDISMAPTTYDAKDPGQSAINASGRRIKNEH